MSNDSNNGTNVYMSLECGKSQPICIKKPLRSTPINEQMAYWPKIDET